MCGRPTDTQLGALPESANDGKRLIDLAAVCRPRSYAEDADLTAVVETNMNAQNERLTKQSTRIGNSVRDSTLGRAAAAAQLTQTRWSPTVSRSLTTDRPCLKVHRRHFEPVRQVSYMMARSNSWMTDYAEEVLSWMHYREMQHIPYNGNSPQIPMRAGIIEFLCMVSERLKLSVATTHLSVYLLDRFMDAHQIADSQLRLTALAAILLAAKFEEKDMNVPRIPELNAFVNNRYGTKIFNSMEAFMLKYFNWNVGTVTVAHFAEFYLMHGITAGDTTEGESLAAPALTRQTLWRTTAHFLDITLQDQVFLQWPSSQVAAACVACGRLFCHLLPTWPVALEGTTGYQLQALSQLMDLLLRLNESEEKSSVCNTPDSGYGSRCSSLQGSP
ncbi:cyclin-J-like [Homarus americanus]|uniref:cyclin-J-like n=1 Tax=Homarus americanus TaxID=6706 RepID=UPI001C474126|nr:cyclin-J-like [Homarus americanus]